MNPRAATSALASRTARYCWRVMRNLGWAKFWNMLRLVVAALILAAVIGQLITSISSATQFDRDVPTTVTNFLSFFTILSNLGAIVVLTWAGGWFWLSRRGARVEPRGLSLVLSSVTTYMIVTGLVYNFLLRGVALPQGTTLPWSNEVLHLVGPLFLLLDLFLGPLRRALPWRATLAALIFPIVWLAYTFVRGPFVINPTTHEAYWYPYPFLDPNGAGGWPSVLIYVVMIAVAIVGVSALVVWVGRGRGSADLHDANTPVEVASVG